MAWQHPRYRLGLTRLALEHRPARTRKGERRGSRRVHNTILIIAFAALGAFSIAAMVSSMILGAFGPALAFAVGVGGSLVGLKGLAP